MQKLEGGKVSSLQMSKNMNCKDFPQPPENIYAKFFIVTVVAQEISSGHTWLLPPRLACIL